MVRMSLSMDMEKQGIEGGYWGREIQ
jgi:hypothetical protein